MVITLTHQVHRAICNCPKYMYVYVIEGFTLLYFQKMSEIILLLTRGVKIINKGCNNISQYKNMHRG